MVLQSILRSFWGAVEGGCCGAGEGCVARGEGLGGSPPPRPEPGAGFWEVLRRPGGFPFTVDVLTLRAFMATWERSKVRWVVGVVGVVLHLLSFSFLSVIMAWKGELKMLARRAMIHSFISFTFSADNTKLSWCPNLNIENYNSLAWLVGGGKREQTLLGYSTNHLAGHDLLFFSHVNLDIILSWISDDKRGNF